MDTTFRDAERDAPLAPSAGDPWAPFDRIYCISLKDRTDRRRRARDEFQRVGLRRVQFVLVDRHPTDSEQGIFESHQACLRAGLDGGAGWTLIFEDDVAFSPGDPAGKLRDAAAFLASDSDCKVLLLGCLVRSSRTTAHRSVLKVRYRCLTHAYAVSRGFARELVDLPWRGVAYDLEVRAMSEGSAYALYPALAHQTEASTDNLKKIRIDRARRLLGGLRVLQRWNEFSSRYFLQLVVAHVVGLGLVIVGALLLRRRR